MAFEGNQYSKLVGIEASADLSASQFRFLELDTNGRCAVVNAASEATCGVLQNKPTALGQAAEICGMGGTSKVVAGAALATLGVYVTNDSTGRAIAATIGTLRHGIVRSVAANAGELVSIELGAFGLAP